MNLEPLLQFIFVVAIALLIISGIAYKRPVFKKPWQERVAVYVLGKPGSRDDIDVTKYVFRAIDITMTGIAGAFIILIAATGFLLPPEVAGIVWLGTAFLLVMLRVPTRNPKGLSAISQIGLMITIVAVGSVTLSAVFAGIPAVYLIGLNLTMFPALLGLALGFRIGGEIAIFVATEVMKAFKEPKTKTFPLPVKVVSNVQQSDLP